MSSLRFRDTVPLQRPCGRREQELKGSPCGWRTECKVEIIQSDVADIGKSQAGQNLAALAGDSIPYLKSKGRLLEDLNK